MKSYKFKSVLNKQYKDFNETVNNTIHPIKNIKLFIDNIRKIVQEENDALYFIMPFLIAIVIQ